MSVPSLPPSRSSCFPAPPRRATSDRNAERSRRPLRCVLFVFVLAAGAVRPGESGATLSMRRWGFQGGTPTRAEAGTLSLGSTLGEYDAGLLVGGSLRLFGGFWFPGMGPSSGVDQEESPTPEVPGAGSLPLIARVYPPAPNPAAESARFAFDLPDARFVEIAVFDVGGRRHRTLLSGEVPAGRHGVTWDLRTEFGERVPTGLYLARVRLGELSRTLRWIVLN